jgi:hypothetical protein
MRREEPQIAGISRHEALLALAYFTGPLGQTFFKYVVLCVKHEGY